MKIYNILNAVCEKLRKMTKEKFMELCRCGYVTLNQEIFRANALKMTAFCGK